MHGPFVSWAVSMISAPNRFERNKAFSLVRVWHISRVNVNKFIILRSNLCIPNWLQSVGLIHTGSSPA
ncbi:hypothetical protein PAECIP111891_05624 [Paenibacillus allorhizoplanae]|uniref:Uncharacterized protein n=1 Tax=Paenibacillus allorhizoplanae TaxID=2905648 RepID=A0ABN8H5D0_9BACL|nr:hypothetical protein PAECIP111891_05624 [Paenibacillus allorhizoplanae]